MKKNLFTTVTVLAFVLGMVFSWGLALGQVEEPIDIAESGRWSFIEKIDHECIDNGNMDFCQADPDNVCKLGIKKDSDGNVLEKKCQN